MRDKIITLTIFKFYASQANEETVHTHQELFNYQEYKPPPRLLLLATHPDMVPDEEVPGVLDTAQEDE